MPGWDDILSEIRSDSHPNKLDIVRRKYMRQLTELTGRNTIAYYSGWLKQQNVSNTDINDSDMTGFMNAVRGLDCSKGLDLILHTPGGSPVAAESIVKYLRCKFDKDIRVIVPHLAMSAGTMIACSASTIVMGKESSLGPIDPQFGGIPAYNIKQEFIEAKEDLAKHPENFSYWKMLLGKYPAAFVKQAIDAIDLSDELLKEWLGSCMFDAIKDAETIQNIVQHLNEHESSKAHGRHFDVSFCKQIGLNVIELEKDNKFQDAVLSVHHVYSHTINMTPVIKIIENQVGKAYISLHGPRPAPK